MSGGSGGGRPTECPGEPSRSDAATGAGDGDPELDARVAAARHAHPAAADLLNLLAFLGDGRVPVARLAGTLREGPGRLRDTRGDPGALTELAGRLADAGVAAVDDAAPCCTVALAPGVGDHLRLKLPRPVAASYLDGAVRVLEALAGDGPADTALPLPEVLEHAVAVGKALRRAGRAPDPAVKAGFGAVPEPPPSDVEALLVPAGNLAGLAGGGGRGGDPFLAAAAADRHAGLLSAGGRRAEASAEADRAVDVARDACAPDDDRLPVLLFNAAETLREVERYRRAAERYREVLALLDGHHGEENPLRVPSLLRLGDASLAAGAPEEAARAFRRAVDATGGREGGEHPDVAAALDGLGRARLSAGDPAGAATLFRRGVRVREELYGREHPALAPALGELGRALEASGREEAARATHRRALAILEEAFGAGHDLVRGVRRRLARLDTPRREGRE